MELSFKQRRLDKLLKKFWRILSERRERSARKFEIAQEKRRKKKLRAEEENSKGKKKFNGFSKDKSEREEKSSTEFTNPNFAVLGFAIAPMAAGAVAVIKGKVVLSENEQRLQKAYSDLLLFYNVSGHSDKKDALVEELRKRNKTWEWYNLKMAEKRREDAEESRPSEAELQEFMNAVLTEEDFTGLVMGGRAEFSDKAQRINDIYIKEAAYLRKVGEIDKLTELAKKRREVFAPATKAMENARAARVAEMEVKIVEDREKMEASFVAKTIEVPRKSSTRGFQNRVPPSKEAAPLTQPLNKQTNTPLKTSVPSHQHGV